MAFIRKRDDGSTLDVLAANAAMIAGVLVGMYAFYAYWITRLTLAREPLRTPAGVRRCATNIF